MTTDTVAYPRAFAVWFRDLGRWDASSFHRIKWHWPEYVMAPIGGALRLRRERVDRAALKFSDLQPITIHFDGSIDKRVVDPDREYSMELWFARPGDVVVAKIDLKNGAVGVVPADWKNVVVTGHFAVYEPDRAKLLPEYFQLIVQAEFFKAHLWRNKVGAEGRKEVKLDFFEKELIPLPSLAEQKAIVVKWRMAQDEMAAARERGERRKGAIEVRFFADLGLKSPEVVAMPRAFSVWWEDFARWGVGFNFLSQCCADLTKGKYPVVRLGDVVADLQNGWSPKCLDRPANNEEWGVLKLGAVSFGDFDESANKAVPSTFKPKPEYEVRPGDVLITRGNVLSLVGAAVYVKETRKHLMLPDLVFRVVWAQKSLIAGPFLAELLQTSILRQQIEFIATGTSPTMKKVTKPGLLDLNIPLPPLAVQKEIMQRIAAGRAEIAREREAAKNVANEIKSDIEALILGAKTLD
jgi:type I restriction enzyme S subunit